MPLERFAWSGAAAAPFARPTAATPGVGKARQLPTCACRPKLTTPRNDAGRITNVAALLRAVRDGGVSPHLRPVVWPLLLGLFAPGDSEAERADKWAAACGEFERLSALAADDGAAAAYYARRVRGGVGAGRSQTPAKGGCGAHQS